jgi:hypothetical protein
MHNHILHCSSGEIGDHKNGNTLDNRRENIRKCTVSQNNSNRIPKKGHCGFKGVSLDKRRSTWVAWIAADKKKIYVGSFTTPERAARAYDQAALIHHGEFARLNFPTT